MKNDAAPAVVVGEVVVEGFELTSGVCGGRGCGAVTPGAETRPG